MATDDPVIAGTRLRTGSSNSARGAARLVADALTNAKKAGAGGLVIMRTDSAYYNADVVAATHRAGAAFSITARLDGSVLAAIASINEQAWTPIHYPNAICDDDQQRLISEPRSPRSATRRSPVGRAETGSTPG